MNMMYLNTEYYTCVVCGAPLSLCTCPPMLPYPANLRGGDR